MPNSRIDDLRKRLDKEPGSRLFAQLAEELRKDGDLAEAIAVCREGLQKHPNYPSARMTLGRALFDTGDLKAARVELEAVVKGAPDNILASRLLADALEGLGDLEGARARYQKILAMSPGDTQDAAKLDALEKRLRGPAAGLLPASVAAPAGAAPGGDERTGKIKLAAAPDEPMVIEQPADARGVASASATAAPVGEEWTGKIKLVAAEENFELERPHEAPTVAFGSAETPAAHAAVTPAAATHHPAEPEVIEFDEAPTLPATRAEAAAAEFARTQAVDLVAAAQPPIPVPTLESMPVPAPVVAAPPAPPEPPPAEPVVPRIEEPAFVESVMVAPTVTEPAVPVPTPVVIVQQPAPEPVPPPSPAPAGPGTEEIASLTLAELYFSQGLPDKGTAVLKQLLAREPNNERAQSRLLEMEAREAQVKVQQDRVAAAVGPTADARALRRQAVERTIAELEKMLKFLRR